MANNQTFTRLSVPDPHVQRVISDLYDKLAAVQQPSTTTTTVTPATPSTTTILSIAGASGTAAGPQFAFVPRLTVLPSNNPTTGAPYAQNGLLIEVNSQLWRYAGAPMYQWQQAGTATTILTDTHANRVANFPAASYPNALFLESDTLVLLVSNSLYWETVAGEVEDTHASRLSTWPSVQFSVNTPFYETDRNVTYTVQNAVGTVTVAGGVNVTWTAGHHFINTGTGFNAAQWPVGTAITIAGVAYAVSVVNSSTSLTLVSAAVNGAGQVYSVGSGRWVYLSGDAQNTQSGIPSDLGENDVRFRYDVTDYGHILQWSGTVWGWAPGEPGSGMMSLFEIDPTGVGWHLYDGSTVSYLKADGTTGSVVLPDLAGTAAFLEGGSPNSGPTSAVAGTVSGSASGSLSDVNSLGGSATVTGTTGADNGSGTIVGAGIGVTVASHPHDHGATLSGSAAVSGLVTVSGSLTVTGTSTGAEPRKLVRRPFFRQ